jgi:hypothetical protein
MRAWTCCLLLALGGCGLGDDVADGSRAQCAEGGALNDTCTREVTTPEQACWRMVDCGALQLHRDNQGSFDWSRCVGEIQDTGDVQARLIIACINASTCDQLKVTAGACFAYGDN